MSNKKVGLIAIGCLTLGVFVGVAGAQVAFLRLFLNTGLFHAKTTDIVRFSTSLDDVQGQPPARVFLQLINASGVVVANKPAVLQPGQSTTLVFTGLGTDVRAHTEVIESVAQPTARRRHVSIVEVEDTLTAERKYVCSFDPVGAGGGRN